MAAHSERLLRHLRRLVARPPADHGTDTALLERFTRGTDEDAFAALVARHGPMVLAVCRRVLRDLHAAEDAAQATFLVLAQRARTIRRPEAMAAWLHRTAHHLALTAHRGENRKRNREALGVRPVPVVSQPDPLDELTARELLAIFDDELRKLPDRHRLPLILCCLEGRTQDEAARQLGWTPGAVKGRLERGRAQLHRRLVGRGLTLSAALATVEAAQGMVPAAHLPAGFVVATVRATVAFTSGAAADPAIAPAVAALAEDGVRSLAMSKVKVILLALLAVPVAAAGVGALARPTPAERRAAEKQVAAQPGLARTDRYGDPVPEGAVARLGTVRLLGGRTVRFGPDGRTIYSGGGRGLHVWDAETGRLRHTIQSQRWEMDVLGIRPDGEAILSEQESPPALWNVEKGQNVRTFGTGDQAERYVSAALSADGRWLACVRQRGPLTVFDVTTGQERFQVKPPDGRMFYRAAVSGDGSVVAVAEINQSSRIRILDGATGHVTQTLPDYAFGPYNLAVAPNGRLVAWTSQKSLTVWDVTAGKKLFEWDTGARSFWVENALAVAPDGSRIAAGYHGGVVIWDLTTGTELRRIDAGGRTARSLSFAPDGRRLAATMDGGGRIAVWEVATGLETVSVHGHSASVSGVAFAPDGRTIATISNGHDPAIRIWDPGTGEHVRAIVTPFSQSAAVTFAPDGRTIAVGGHQSGEPVGPGSVHRWDAQSGAAVGSVALPEGAWPLLLSPARDAIFATSVRDRYRFVWDPTTGRELVRFSTDERGYGSSAVTPDSRRWVTGDGQRLLVVWDRDERKLRSLAVSPGLGSPYAAISDDGRTVAAAYGRTVFGLWEVASGLERRQFRPLGVTVPLALSPDGRILAYGVSDTSSRTPVRLMDVATDAELACCEGHLGRVWTLAFSPDGRFVVTGSSDTTALVWPVPRPPALPTDVNVEACWADLGGPDAAKAYTAHWHMSAVPARSVPVLAERLRPAAPLTAAQRAEVTRAIGDLDSDKFAVRQQAVQRLTEIGAPAAAVLREALAARPSAEAKQQIEHLLAEANAPTVTGEELRAIRAVEVLERIGSADARRVLERLAGGTPGASRTRDAKAALDRLTPKR